MPGKIISDGLGAATRLYTAFLEAVRFFYSIYTGADFADQLENVAHIHDAENNTCVGFWNSVLRLDSFVSLETFARGVGTSLVAQNVRK